MRLIDADKLKEYVNSISSGLLCEWDTLGVLSAIDKQQAIDAVPVVRCKNCAQRKYCEIYTYVDEDFFCANGIQEDEEQDDEARND